MEGGCAYRGTLGRTLSATSASTTASTTVLSTAASRNCGDKARGELKVGMWTLLPSQMPLPRPGGARQPPDEKEAVNCTNILPLSQEAGGRAGPIPLSSQAQRQSCSFRPQSELSRLPSVLA